MFCLVFFVSSLMLALFVFHAFSSFYNHQQFAAKHMYDEEAMRQRISNTKLKSTKKQKPIRIKFDNIGWTDQQMKAKVEKTTNNVGDYLKRLLKVIP